MNKLLKLSLLPLLLASSQTALASGQRTTLVTYEAIESYQEIHINEEAFALGTLHYIGTVGQSKHLLMVTKTSYSKRKERKSGEPRIVGRPWDHVFRYYISAEEISFANGWDLTNRLNNGGFKVRPSDCPGIRLSTELKRYSIRNDPNIQRKCMGERRVRNKREQNQE